MRRNAIYLRDRQSAGSQVHARRVIDPYVQIQRALNLGTVDGIRERAREIATQAKALGPDAEAIRRTATAIDRLLAIAEVRTAFGTLGNARSQQGQQGRSQARTDKSVR